MNCLFDEFGLSANRNTSHPKHGSWVGHVSKYNSTRKELDSLVTQAKLTTQCKTYVTTEMTKWASQGAPAQPNRKEAAASGYITPDKITKLKRAGKL